MLQERECEFSEQEMGGGGLGRGEAQGLTEQRETQVEVDNPKLVRIPIYRDCKH